MGVIVPAILPASFTDLKEKLARFEGHADFVQIDIVDGVFAKPASWPYAKGAGELSALAERGENLPYWGKMKFDIDLMVAHPEEVTGAWIELGASRITVHAESTNYLPRLVTDFEAQYGHARDFAPDLISFGLAVGISSDLSLIEPFIPYIDYVQFMGIRTIGKQGEPFDKGVVERVRAFKKAHPKTAIQVDGGVSLVTAPALLSAGVDRLIVGSALQYAPDLDQAFRAFDDLTHRYGLYA